MGTGLKKCIPMTRVGSSTQPAILEIEIEEVHDACQSSYRVIIDAFDKYACQSGEADTITLNQYLVSFTNPQMHFLAFASFSFCATVFSRFCFLSFSTGLFK